MFDSPKEALFRAYRECGWAVKINVSVEPKCSWLVNKIKENEPISDSAYAGRLWMQVAEYQLVKGNVNESKSACRKVIESYNLVNVDMDLISNKRTSLEICQALFKKYGP
jgi:hypothetical protein